jgi:hyperosmotically inducible protein
MNCTNTRLIAALAAAGLVAAGCQQQAGSDKTGKSNQANPSMMGKAGKPSDQTAQSSPPSSSSSSSSDQMAKSDQGASNNPPATSDQNKDKDQQPGRTDQSATNQASAGSKFAGAEDTMITTKVKAALLAEPGLKLQQIDVTTKDAMVTLAGAVDSDIVRDRAKQIALSTEGVKRRRQHQPQERGVS